MTDKILELSRKRFTILFKKLNDEELKEEGEYAYPPVFLDKIDVVLDDYIENVIRAIDNKDKDLLLSSVKKAVISFNNLDNKYHEIETDCREGIVFFLNETAKLSGLLDENTEELTYKWKIW